MPTIVDRDEMVGLLREEFAVISEMCRSFGDDVWAAQTCLPGWTVKDQVSHMAGTEQMLAGVKAPEVDVSHLTHLRNDIGRANEVWIEANRHLPGPDVLAIFDAITAERLAALEAMTQEDFDAPSWTPAGKDETYGRFMRIRHYDCYSHEHDIRAAAGLPDRMAEAHLASALREPETALGYIVGRKAGMPDGSNVRIRLTGPVEREYLVAVAGRAGVVESFEGDVTAGIELPGLLWLRLTGGREGAEAHIGGDLKLEGDEVLARQLATNLTFTI